MGVNGLPRAGDSYTSPSSYQKLYRAAKTAAGPYYNISVTLDFETLKIVNSWERGTKSERIRWAIKDAAYGRSPARAEKIAELEQAVVNHLNLQKKLLAKIDELELELSAVTPKGRDSDSFTSIRGFFRSLFWK